MGKRKEKREKRKERELFARVDYFRLKPASVGRDELKNFISVCQEASLLRGLPRGV
jgi:hypothetical protein